MPNPANLIMPGETGRGIDSMVRLARVGSEPGRLIIATFGLGIGAVRDTLRSFRSIRSGISATWLELKHHSPH